MFEFFAGFHLGEIFKATMVLFAVIDIIGTIPLILKIKQESGNIHPIATTTTSFLILVCFLILGESILELFGVNIESFAVAGSFILFALSLEMILGVTLFKGDDPGAKKTVSIVPLAFPIIAGAGSMTTIISLRAEYETINILIAILINLVFVHIVLLSAKRIEAFMGDVGIAILKKVFGIILLAIAVKLFSSNITQLFVTAP